MLSKLIEWYLNFISKRFILGCLTTIVLISILGVIATVINSWITISIGSVIFMYMLYFLYKEEKLEKEGAAKSLAIGKILFEKYEPEFAEYYSLYLEDKKEFFKKYAKTYKLKKTDDNKLIYLDVVKAFAKQKMLSLRLNCKWESYDFEFIEAIEKSFNIKPEWNNLKNLYNEIEEGKREKYAFVLDILRSINKDLNTVGHSLIFLLGDDYDVIVVATDVAEKIKAFALGTIYGADSLY